MKKLNVCVLFGGISPEHEVSLRSAEFVLNQIDHEKYNILPVGITKDGDWILFGGTDYSTLPTKLWINHDSNRRAFLSPIRGQGLLCFENERIIYQPIDVVFPVLHGINGEDGAIQGLLEITGIPYVGSDIAASATCMDKCMTKLMADQIEIRQADWLLVTQAAYNRSREDICNMAESRFTYPMFVKPANTGSSIGVSKAKNREELFNALESALCYDHKILVEEYIIAQEVECAVLGNQVLSTSICGEIVPGADFYDYDAKYISDSSSLYIPARISEQAAETVRRISVKVYEAMGCRGLGRVDFFVKPDGEVVFNEINTLPGFTSISMYPKLFQASGISYTELIDRLLTLALEK